MRKLLNWDTTYINRDNTNENIYLEINKKIREATAKTNQTRKEEKKKRKKTQVIVIFAEFYKK